MTVAPPGPDLTAPPDVETEGRTRVLTGEAVHLDLRVAGIGSRALARMFDLLVQGALAALLVWIGLWVILFLGSQGALVLDGALVGALYIALIIAVFVGYPVVMETLTRGRTLGKLVFGLRVVREDGGPVGLRQTLTRSLVALAIEFPGLLLPPITWLATMWVMIGNPRSKRLGDHVAGTMVIHDRTPAAWGWVPAMPPSLAMWAGTLDLAGLDDDLAFAVRSFLARNRRLREPARTVLGERLVREVAAVTNPPPPAGTPAWMYLAAVHAERHRRAMLHLASIRSRSATVWPELAAAVARPAMAPPRTPPSGPATPAGADAGRVPAPGGLPTVRPAQPNSEAPQ